MAGIFEGLRVIELANVLAGPSVGQFLAELGAEVIKVENPATQGDVTRSWKLGSEQGNSSVSAYFSAANSGKKSIALSLKDSEELNSLYELVKISDFVIVSYKPGDAKKLGVDYERLKLVNPKIIYGQITGYGEEDERVGYDAIIQAETGFMKMNGEPGGNSLKMPVALMDVLAAHQLKEAILVAYIHLLQSQKGCKVSVSLFESAVSALVNQATNYLIAGHVPKKMGAEHPNIAPYGTVLLTKDKKEILLAVGTNKQFKALCHVLQLDNLAESANYSTNENRVKNRIELNNRLKQSAKNYSQEHLMKAFQDQNIPAGRLRTVQEVFESGEANHLLIKEGSQAKGLKNFIPALSDKLKNPHNTPPPELDQDRAYVLSLISK